MNTQPQLHYLQKTLLKKLALTPKAKRFNDLIVEGYESEHMNYHLQKLIESGHIQKQEDGYVLSDLGKDYTNLLDDDVETVERQPKTSIIIIATRKNEKGDDEYLMCKRLKHPYFGIVGPLTGKVRFGETLEEAVLRELYEEAGLTARSVTLIDIYHKIRRRQNGEAIQDVLFYRHVVKDISGSFIPKTLLQENLWLTEEEILKRTDLYDSYVFKSADNYLKSTFSFSEDVGFAKDF